MQGISESGFSKSIWENIKMNAVFQFNVSENMKRLHEIVIKEKFAIFQLKLAKRKKSSKG